MQRSGAMTPRRAACARSKREVCVGKRSVTWRAMSAPVAVMPMKIGPVHARIAARRLLAQRGVRLVADDDRVGVGDAPGVAHEPLVGLDRDRAVGAVGAVAVEQRRRLAVAVAAVAQLAEELVDEVAAVGEDQDAAGARGLDEAHRGDGLAGAGGVLEPEALVGVGVVGGALVDVLVDVVARRRPPRRPRAPRRRRRRSSGSASARRPRRRRRRRRTRLVVVVVLVSRRRARGSSSGSSGAARRPRARARRRPRGPGRRPAPATPLAVLGARPAARSACPRARRPGGG